MILTESRPIATSAELTRQDTVKVLGIGRTGIRILHKLYKNKVSEVEYYAIHTDQFHCEGLNGPRKIQIGKGTMEGFGAAGDPDKGVSAAEESQEGIRQIVQGADLVVVTVGLGGGTGSGAAPYIASLAKEAGSMVMAAVTMPYGFEATERRRNAAESLASLKNIVDTIIVVSLEKSMAISGLNENETLERAYSILDEGIQNVLKTTSPIASKGKFGAVSAMLSLAALR